MSIRLKKHLREVLQDMCREGFTVEDVEVRGTGHYRIHVSCGGRQAVATLGSSPSDRRARMNMLRDVRRQFAVRA